MSKQRGYKMFRLYYVPVYIKLSWKNVNTIRDVDWAHSSSGVTVRG
ncbi:hypothetical protein HMPREF1861_00380 [Corynebacterium kroppenstedtii]|nr:hypothetical protein HMPREF1861_00380 [Corynebacterium kroppenstedtii]